MNDRERLVELLVGAMAAWDDYIDEIIRAYTETGIERDNIIRYKDYIADYLIANGVTIQKHGRWIDRGWHGDWNWQIDGRGQCWHVYECSECGARKCCGPKINYCPNCGAKMDEENTNENRNT